MQNSLFRTGFSTIVRESQDASCALMNAKGEVVAQHVVLPLHIGAFPACTAAIIDAFRDGIAPGDAFIINHPYHGGSPHAPDVAVITPVFVAGELFGFCGSIAHKSDIGGPVPGSCSGQAREIFNEGLHLPAVRYQRDYRPIGDIERLIGANSRTPELVLGDIRGQLGADRLGEKRLDELVGKFGREKIRRRKTRQQATFRFQRLGGPDQRARQYPPAAGASSLRLRADLVDRPEHVCVERPPARLRHDRARR
jgi:N-methylhydantoinase B